MTNEICHMIWIGSEQSFNIINKKCIQSFIFNNFNVQLWSFNKEIQINGTTPRDLYDIFDPKKITTTYHSNLILSDTIHKNVLLSDIARLLIIKKEGGWYFDCDAFNLKDQSEYKKLRANNSVFIKDKHNNVINGIYFLQQRVADQIFSNYDVSYFTNLNEKNYYWGTFGSGIMNKIVINDSNILPTELFLPIDYTEFDLFLHRKHNKHLMRKVKTAFQIHLYGSTFNSKKIDLNKIDKLSFLYNIINSDLYNINDIYFKLSK